MAAPVKVSQLPEITTVTHDDLMYVANDPSGTPTSNKLTVRNFLQSNVAANVAFNGPLTLSGLATASAFVPSYNSTPANSTAVPVGFSVGSFWTDNNYIYIVTGVSEVKRVPVSTW